jgi:folate-binding protein YgfZ
VTQSPEAIARTSALAPLHGRLAQEFEQVGGVAIPVHYGDPEAEYRALREGCGLLDRSWAASLELTGSDCVRFLHGFVTCEVQGVESGSGTYGFLTSQQGRILSDLVLLRLEDRLWLELPPGLGGKVKAHLEKYRIVEQLEILELDSLTLLSLIGPHAEQILAPAATLPQGSWHHAMCELADHEVRVSRDPRLGVPAFSLWLPAEGAVAVVERLLESGRSSRPMPVGVEAFEQLRIESGMPRFGHDFHSDHLPQETGIEAAVSYSKGCYLGQEVVARVHYRGQAQRILRGLLFSGSETPAPGTPLLYEGREAGVVGSAAFSPVLRRPAGLSVLHRRAAEPGTHLRLNGERGAAATGTDGSGVVELETGAAHSQNVVDRRAVEVASADRVHVHVQPVVAQDLVVGALLVLEVQGVLKAAATTAHHRDAQAVGGVHAFLLAG